MLLKKKYSDFGGGKKKSDSEFLSYKLMLNSVEKNILTFVLSENQIKIYEDGICGSEPAI